MVYIVEIANRDNERAIKEYNVASLKVLMELLKYELARYPRFRLVNAWEKEQPDRLIFAPAP